MAISRILSGRGSDQDDHLSLPDFSERPANLHSPWCDDTRDQRTGCPSSVLSCTAWGFSCLANYFASGELLPRLFTLTGTLKNRRYLFCDTLRHRSFSTAMPACFTRHAAVWCSDFPPASQYDSPAIICHRLVVYHKGRRIKRRKAAAHPNTRTALR
jgi:hypothetical protein